MFRDVVVVAHLRQGNHAGALAALRGLTLPSLTSDAAYSLKTTMFYWYIAQAAGQLETDADARP
jgi:hypothetical protein